MVKKIVVLATMLVTVVGFAEPLTNATSLVGVTLTTNEISRLPSCSAVSPDTVFLGTVKALQTGDLRGLYYHFETNYMFSLIGYNTPSNVPAGMVSSFRSAMSDGSFSNIVIAAYSTSVSNQLVRVSATLQENFVGRTLTEPLTLTLRQYVNGWKIVVYDDDKWDE